MLARERPALLAYPRHLPTLHLLSGVAMGPSPASHLLCTPELPLGSLGPQGWQQAELLAFSWAAWKPR